ncbi:hypothetical protein [Herpetosiphon geysericola]|uniref:Uncharacterized protein n=1 Tax=Herpetosiphon geysericola TaxID=70996 RepID=A0A0P6YAX1_9CHLR|nr:hypothetical protein [Herpetosiphon geysericola]KPL90417.1 hypothetical protein SE18_07365 [Herpetosiphon geysericola]
MSNQPNYYPSTPPNNQPNYQDPNQGQYQPQAPYGQNPYQAQYQPQAPYYVPNILQTDPKIDRRRSNIAFGLCIVAIIIGGLLLNTNAGSSDPIVSSIFFVLGTVAWVTAWCFSTKSKGYSPWLGLISILGVLGMIVLMIIPNRNKIRY